MSDLPRNGESETAPAPGTPALPPFNWGAFFIPPIWGVAHGQWPAAFFLPAWVFVDNMIRTGGELTVWGKLAGWGMLVATMALQAAFARNANVVAYARVADRMSIEDYVRRQRAWAVVGAVTFVGMVAWIAAFSLRS